MAAPERPTADISSIPTKAELITALSDIERQLELADENENTIERFFKRDELLEQQDLLQAEAQVSASHSEPLKPVSE